MEYLKVNFRKISWCLALILVLNVFSANSISFASSKDDKINKEKQEMLESVWEQLESQNATKFYPMYKQIVEDKFENLQENRSTSSRRVSMPKGGSIYYSNYLNSGTKVYQTYLDKAATTKAVNGTLAADAISSTLQWGLGTIAWPVGILLVLSNLIDRDINRQIANGTGCMELMYSNDGDTSSKIKLHWSKAPYATLYDGAKVSIKR